MLTSRKVVASSGTAVQLTTQALYNQVLIVTALEGNTEKVVLGGSDVVAATGTRKGVALVASETIQIPVPDLSAIYIDAEVNGEGVSFISLDAYLPPAYRT